MFKFLRKILLGPAYFQHVRLIINSKKWSTSEIETYQARKGAKNVNGYITKEDINNNPHKFINNSLFMPMKMVRTGGTSGKPFRFYQDLLYARQKERAYLFDIWKEIGYKPFDYRIVVRGNIPNKDVKNDLISNSMIISQNYFTDDNRDYLIKLFNDKAFFLHVYPSSLMFLIDFFGEQRFSEFPIKGILAGSEAFPLEQMKWFKDKFKIEVAHWYGHSEYAILARFCNECEEFHFYPTYGKMTLFKENDQYKILATSFNKYGTQFVNYFTGDYAIQAKQNCSQDNFQKIHAILGREQEFVYDKSGVKRAFGPYLFGIHSKFWDTILGVQFIQRQIGHIDVLFIPSSAYSDLHFRDTLIKRFELFNLKFFKVDTIDKTTSGKHKYFKQLVN